MEKKKKKKRLPNDSWSKEDYKKFVYNLMTRGCNKESYRKIKIAEAFDYYYGKSSNKEYSNLLSIHETDRNAGGTPFVPLNFDTISSKVNLLLGELNARGFEISINAANIESLKRKRVFKQQLEFQMQMQQVFQSAAGFTGVPFGINENLPRNDEELTAFMESYKDAYELIMEEAVNESIDVYKYEYLRKNLFLDLIVSNEVTAKLESRNGFDQFRRVNPLNGIGDIGEDDFQSDQSHFLEVYYMSIPDAIERFDIEEDVLIRMQKAYRDADYSGWRGVKGTGEFANKTYFAPFEGSGNQDEFSRVLIVEASWVDNEVFSQKVTHDPHGNIHVHNFEGFSNDAKLSGKEKKNSNNSIERKKLQVVREAVLIGGDHLVSFGKPSNQPRDFSNPETTRLNYIRLIHNYNNGESVSFIDRVKSLQDMKNYVLTIAQKEITTNIGNTLYIDKSRIDTETYGKGAEAIEELWSIMKSRKIVVGDSSKNSAYNNPQDGIPFRNIEGRSSSIITECLNVAIFLEEEINKITGINESRLGNAGERQLASVNAQKLNQSGFVTNTLFHAFNGFEVRLFEQHVYRLASTLSENRERLEILAERVGVKLPETMEIDLQSYRVSIEAYPLSRQDLQVAAQASLQQGNLQFPDFLRIMTMANSKGGLKKSIRKYLTIVEKREKERQQLELQQQQIAAQQQQAAQQYDMNKIMQLQMLKNQGGLEKARVENSELLRREKLKINSEDRKTEAHLVTASDNLRQR